MSIKAVIFDIGGVLEYTPESHGWFAKWENIFDFKEGQLYKSIETLLVDGSTGAITEDTFYEEIKTRLQLNENDFERFRDDLWRVYLGEWNQELADYFSSLRPCFKTAILSNSFVGAREREVERYQVDELSDLLIYSHEVGMCKPDKEIYELTSNRLSVKPAQCVFVDDKQENIDAAIDTGMEAVLFNNNAQTISAIQKLIAD